MNALLKKCLLAAAALATAGSVYAEQPQSAQEPLYVNTSGMSPSVARKVEAEAAKGFNALRYYVQRTQRMHHLSLASIVLTREEAEALAKAKGQSQNCYAQIAQVDTR
jgi:hypothetical protein